MRRDVYNSLLYLNALISAAVLSRGLVLVRFMITLSLLNALKSVLCCFHPVLNEIFMVLYVANV